MEKVFFHRFLFSNSTEDTRLTVADGMKKSDKTL